MLVPPRAVNLEKKFCAKMLETPTGSAYLLEFVSKLSEFAAGTFNLKAEKSAFVCVSTPP